MAAGDRKRRKFTILQYKNEIFLAGMIVFVGAGVFVFFKSFFDSEINNLTTEILAALLGSIITIIITMLLIRQQGTIEQTMDTATASKTMVFNEKLKLFREFVQAYTKFAIDNELSPKELEKLEVLSLTIALLARRIHTPEGVIDLADGLSRFVLQLQLFGLENDYERLDETQRKVYSDYFGDLNDVFAKEDNPVFQGNKMVNFTDILSMMKVELVTAQWDGLEMDEDLLEGSRYNQTWKLLNYRDYRVTRDDQSR